MLAFMLMLVDYIYVISVQFYDYVIRLPVAPPLPLNKISEDMRIMCATINPRAELFPISISANDLVGELKDAIVRKQLYEFPASRLRLYTAINLANKWITELEFCRSPNDIMMTPDQEMWTTDSVQESVNRMIPFDAKAHGVIHVFVKLPDDCCGEPVAALVKRELKAASIPSPRKERWDKLNVRLQRTTQPSSKKWFQARAVLGLLSWEDISDIYDPILDDEFVQEVDEIPAKTIIELERVLGARTQNYGVVSTGKESKRLFFIEPILIAVMDLFGPEEQLRLLVQETIMGDYVNANGCSDFTIKNGDTTACIVIATTDDLETALVQATISLEVISDVEEKEVIWAVITNFKDWIFLCRTDDDLKRDNDLLNIKESSSVELTRIAGKLCSILTDD